MSRFFSIVFYVLFILSIPTGIKSVVEKLQGNESQEYLIGYVVGTFLFSIILLIIAVKLGQAANLKKKLLKEDEPEYFVDDE